VHIYPYHIFSIMCTCLADDNVIYLVIHVDYCPSATDRFLSISLTIVSVTWFIELCQRV